MKKIKWTQIILPVSILTLAIIFLISASVFIPDGAISNLTYLLTGIRILIYFLIAAVANSIIHTIMSENIISQSAGGTFARALINFLSVFTYAIAIITVLVAEIKIELTGTWLSIILLFIILGSIFRERIIGKFSNIAGETERSYGIGDWVKIYSDNFTNTITGQVIDVNRQYLILKAEDKTTVSIPNYLLTVLVIQNYYDSSRKISIDLELLFPVEHSFSELKKILISSVKQLNLSYNFCENPETQVLLKSMDPDNLTVKIKFNLIPWKEYSPEFILSELQELIKTNLIYAGYDYGRDYKPRDVFARKLKVLNHIILFKALNGDEKKTLAEKTELLNIDSNELIIEEGETGESMYVLAEGLLEVFVDNKLGHQIKVADLVPGQFFGEMSLLTGEKRTATVKAGFESVVLKIEKESIQQIIEKRPQIIEQLVEIIAERKKETESKKSNSEKKESGFVDNLIHKIKIFFRVTV